MTVQFVPNPAGIFWVTQAPNGTTGIYLGGLTSAIAARARQLAPVNTGALRNSITPRIFAAPLRSTVIADVDYAAFVHEGTSAHEIVPTKAKVLRFPTKGGAVVFTQRVDHPGTAPNPFLADAMADLITF